MKTSFPEFFVINHCLFLKNAMYYCILFFITFVQCIPLENMNLGHCGLMQSPFQPESHRHRDRDIEDYEDYGTRIVGGFDHPEPVPWFVMLAIDTQNGTFSGHKCGATLITDRFILTAAHCLCNTHVKYCHHQDRMSKITDIVALIGLAHAHHLPELLDSQSTYDERHLRFISNVIIHEAFEPNTDNDPLPRGPDIALLKMHKAVPK